MPRESRLRLDPEESTELVQEWLPRRQEWPEPGGSHVQMTMCWAVAAAILAKHGLTLSIPNATLAFLMAVFAFPFR